MNNLRKEVSSIILNDNQFERAINTLVLQIIPPIENAVAQSNETETPYQEACFYVARELIHLIGNFEPEEICDNLAVDKLAKRKKLLLSLKNGIGQYVECIENTLVGVRNDF